MSKRIVVLDDDRQLAMFVGEYLETLGYSVRVTDTGREAVDLLGTWPPDLLISDMNMPEMDGVEVLLTARKNTNVPVIVMSGGGVFSKDLLLANAVALGAVSVLRKPFAMEELGSLVRSAIGSGATEQSGA